MSLHVKQASACMGVRIVDDLNPMHAEVHVTHKFDFIN